MELKADMVGDLLILKVLSERIDAAAAIALKQGFMEKIDGHSGRVLMDLDQVEFMDSSGLGAMVASLKMLEGRALELVNLHGAVARVFSLTRMDRVFEIHEDAGAVIGETDSGEAA